LAEGVFSFVPLTTLKHLMMQTDPLLIDTILESSIYTLDNFYTSTLEKKQELLSMIHKNVQCIVIVSEVGMGGTHLLAGIYKELKAETTSIDYEKLLNKHKKEGVKKLNLKRFKYLFLDDWHAFYNKCEAYLSFVEFIENELRQFVLNGGKLFMKVNPLHTTTQLNLFVNHFSNQEIKLDKVEPVVLKKILEDMFQQMGFELNRDVEVKILSEEYACYRHFQGRCITWMAYNKVERIENMNLD